MTYMVVDPCVYVQKTITDNLASRHMGMSKTLEIWNYGYFHLFNFLNSQVSLSSIIDPLFIRLWLLLLFFNSDYLGDLHICS